MYGKKTLCITITDDEVYSKFACQELIKICKFGGRGKIPETFSPSDEIDLSWEKNEFAKQYRLWISVRYKSKSPVDNGSHIPSFAAVKSLLDSYTRFITKCTFTPILLYPKTEYNAIFTTMINSQHVNLKIVLFGRMKVRTILQKKYSSYIHKNLVIYSLGLAASI